MPLNPSYKASYTDSWALVIGVDEYANTSPLSYAVSDAEAVSETLVSQLGFPEQNVQLLTDADATQRNILHEVHQYRARNMAPDDRLVVFFAGHGHTETGHRGEVGFLVPVDGDLKDPSTLIRWDDLTKAAELIPGKHVLFVMDACYGGLARTRTAKPGSKRFLRDILRRRSRQVITAGKADQVVADAGGPRPGHSVFTGHFLDAIEGEAKTDDGIITAQNVMGYVYEHVAKDYESRQTPEFGSLDGDGDLVLHMADDVLASLGEAEETEDDVLVSMSGVVQPQDEFSEPDHVERLEEYLSDPRYRIPLDRLVTDQLKAVRRETSEDRLPLDTPTLDADDFVERLQHYEEVCGSLLDTVALLGRWGEARHQPLLRRVSHHLTDFQRHEAGKVSWIALRWYPALLASYVGGISALTTDNYASLATLLTTRVGARQVGEEPTPAALAMVRGISEAAKAGGFKLIPGHERNFVPRSEYLFKTLQPRLEDRLFLGSRYEELFDRFEIMLNLVYVDLRFPEDREELNGRIWAPVGRFGWKFAKRRQPDPVTRLLDEVENAGDSWPPLEAGLFGGSVDRVLQLGRALQGVIQGRSWW